MKNRSIIGTIFSRRRTNSKSRHNQRRRFGTFIERLEARQLLATFMVNSTADGIDVWPGDGISDDGAGNSTLRGAIIEANALPGPDTIIVPAGNYGLTLAGTNDDYAFSGDLDITDDLTIMGAGAANTVIDAAGLDRVFHIPQLFAPTSVSSVTLDGLTIKGGLATDAGGLGTSFFAASGGGILNEVFGNSITLSGSIVTENTALGSAFLYSSDAQGGGIADVGGNWTISGSEITQNDALAVAGPFGPGTARGGGMYAEYTTTNLLIDTAVSNNEAVGGADDGLVGTGAGQGGGIFGNSGTWVMAGSTTADSNQARGGLGIVSPGGAGEGGGIYSQFSFWNFTLSPGIVLSRNAAVGGDGGFAGGGAAGGGIYSAYDSWFDPFTFSPITNNTISGNTATGGNADPVFGGGGAALGGGVFTLGTMIAEHMTIADNDATGGLGAFAGFGDGGGIYSGSLGVSLKSTIVAENTASTSNPDVSGSFSSAGYNLIGDVGTATGFGLPGDLVGTAASPIDPMLGPLQDNGGPTESHELLAGSPAIDAADPFSLVLTDQRGVGRPIDGNTDTVAINDIGTYEASAPVAAAAAVAIETRTNGIDADDPTGPLIGVGSAANFTYIVTNPGGVALSNVAVTDSQGVVVSFAGGDANANTLLDPGETWTFNGSKPVTTGQYMNTGTVTADDPLLMSVTDTDDSHHFGVVLGIDIETSTDGLDADAPAGPQILVGGTASFTYTVTNTGNVALENVAVSDSQGVVVTYQSGDTDVDNELDVDETWIYTGNTIVTAGQYMNTGTAVGDDATDTVPGQIMATDASHHFGADPSLSVIQEVSVDGGVTWQDANSPTGPTLLSGTNPQFRYTVNNTGNVALDVTLSDDVLALPAAPGTLAANDGVPGGADEFVYIFTGATWQAGQHTNTATVMSSFTDSAGTTEYVSEMDDANYFGADPALSVIQEVSVDGGSTWQDANSPTGPTLVAGTNPQFRYTVNNTGNVALDVTLSDDVFTPASDPGTLAANDGLPGGSDEFVYIFTGATWQAGQHTNQATVTSSFTDSAGTTEDVSAMDDANYFGADPAIDIETATAGQDADDPTGPTLTVGDAVTFTHVITNTGNVNFDIFDMAVADSVMGVMTSVVDQGDGDSILEVGESWTYETMSIVLAGQYMTTGTVNADFVDHAANFAQATDSDNSHYFGEQSGGEQSAGGEGCTPGFWKSHSHYGPAPEAGWADTDYDPDQLVDDVFGTSQFGTTTLLEAMETGGGGADALMRHAVAALLNASNPNVSYDLTVNEVIQMTNDALAPGGDVEGTKDIFADFNEQGCDLSPGGGGGSGGGGGGGGGEPVGATVQGMVWIDANGNGHVDFGEEALQNVTVSLTGFDSQGNYLMLSEVTDADGVYQFDNLPASDANGYTITEVQPAGFDNDREHAGSINGTLVGDDADIFDDEFTLLLALGDVAEDFNFAEQAGDQTGVYLEAGMTATIGFWQNKNGQNLIKSLNGGQNDTQLGTWLASTFPELYGTTSADPVNGLAGKTNREVAAYFKTIFQTKKKRGGGPTKLDPQSMAVALSVYVTDRGLAGGDVAANYGFSTFDPIAGQAGMAGTGGRLMDVDAAVGAGTSETLFGAGTPSIMTVMDILILTNERSSDGVLFEDPNDGDSEIDFFEAILRSLANDLFTAINEGGDI